MSTRRLCGAIAVTSALILSQCVRPEDVEQPRSIDGQEVTGILEVTERLATVIGLGNDRVLLVSDPPQTAVDLETMMAKTAEALRSLHGRHVRVRGRRQNEILWSAEVIEPKPEKKTP